MSEQSDRFPRIVRPALRHCDYVIVNELEAAAATGLPAADAAGRVTAASLRALAEAVLACGVREQVVVHSPEVSVSVDRAGTFAAVPSLELPEGWIAGSVGAGDAFCAGMLYSVMKGMPAEEGLRLASCAAACNLAAPDSVSGARALAETWSLDARFPRKSLA